MPELLSQRARALAHPVIRALVPNRKGLVAVLNGQRQILLLNDALVLELGHRDSKEAIGLRLGEALGCANAAAMVSGCGTSVSCPRCGALVATQQALASALPERHQYDPTVARGLVETTLHFFVRATGYDVEDGRLVLFAMQPVAEA
jgi:hypothetical protein